MGGDVRTLWRAIRRPMLRWWKRVGIWLLAAILAFYAADTLTWFGTLGTVHIGVLRGFSWSAPAVIVHTVTMLWAATMCSRLLTQVYEQHAAPEPPGFLRARFLLCYLQALIPLSLSMVARVFSTALINRYGFYFQSQYGPLRASFVDVINSTSETMALLLGGAVATAWLVCLLVLVPRRPLLAWILPLAGIAGGLPVYLLYAYAPPPSFSIPGALYSGWGWLLGGVLLLFMFYALRSGLDRLMYAAYGLLVAAQFSSAMLVYLLYQGVGEPVRALMRLSFNIPRFSFDSPFDWHPFIEWAELSYPAHETVLGSFAILLPLIVEPLWALGMLALIYYVILAPWWGNKRPAASASGRP